MEISKYKIASQIQVRVPGSVSRELIRERNIKQHCV